LFSICNNYLYRENVEKNFSSGGGMMVQNEIKRRISCIMIALSLFLSTSLLHAARYINKTGKTIIIRNVTAKKRFKHEEWSNWWHRIPIEQRSTDNSEYEIVLQDGQKGNLDNEQGDEITIRSPGISDKRRLFPSNNYYNYVVTYNAYSDKFERFDINRAEYHENEQ
jgi:hypothetical protein